MYLNITKIVRATTGLCSNTRAKKNNNNKKSVNSFAIGTFLMVGPKKCQQICNRLFPFGWSKTEYWLQKLVMR